jgi:hypothetical protein
MRRRPLTNNNKKQKQGTAQSSMRWINSLDGKLLLVPLIKMKNFVQNYHSSDKDIPNSNNLHKTVRDRTITKQISDLRQVHKMQC